MAAGAAKALAACAFIGWSEAGLISFESFTEQHARSYEYGGEEFQMRRALFEQRLLDAKLQNFIPGRTWTAGVNKLWDWTDAERQTLLGWAGSSRPEVAGHGVRARSFLQQRAEELPKEKIWSDLAMAQRVKNQASCGSCWAIATSNVLEAHAQIHTGKVRSFSAQQIVSCTPNPKRCGGDGGCKGATAELGMEWVLKNGCAEEADDPYQGVDENCSANTAVTDMAQALGGVATSFLMDGPAARGGAAFGMTGWETLPKNKYEPLARALVEKGPVAVSVAADTWFDYESGIFNNCGKDAVINHAVTAIGFGEEEGHKFWLIQNSWGADWGERGYIRLERHAADEYCGMNNDPQKGVACEGETEPVPVCGMCGVLFDSVVPHFQALA